MSISITSVEIVARKMEFLKELYRTGQTDKDGSIVEGVKSQASFAAFEYPKLLLHRISLNNLKATADVALDGGFFAMDSLRKEIHSQLTAPAEVSPLPRSDSKAELLKGKSQLEQQIRILRENNMKLTYMIREVLDRYRTVAFAPPDSIRARYATDATEIHSMLAGLGILALDIQ